MTVSADTRNPPRGQPSAIILPLFKGERGPMRVRRFLEHVERGAQNDCWPWRRSTNHGYGRFKIASHKTVPAHRAAWALANDRDPGALSVRHRCDNPTCCNPAHLEIGTHADNMADKVARGRCRTGDQAGTSNPRALITDEQLAEIVERLKDGEPNTSIARDYPIGHSMVSKIRTGVMWQEQAAALGWQPAIDRLSRNDLSGVAL